MPAMLPDFESLHLFLRAVELQSLSKAAASMHMTAPAASRRLSQLEHVYGIQLLLRTTRGVALTPAGKVLREHASRLLEAAFDTRAAMAAHAAEKQDVVRLHANTSAATWHLPGDLAQFKRANPSLQLEVVECHSRSVIEALQSGEADAGIFTAGHATDGLHCQAYRSDRLAAIFPPGSTRFGPSISFEELLDHDLVTLEGGTDLSRLIAERAQSLHKPLRLRLQMKTFHSVCRMVESGMGVGLLPLQASMEITSSQGLQCVPLSDDWAERPLMLGYREGRRLRQAVHRLVDHLAAPVVAPGTLSMADARRARSRPTMP